MSDTTIVYYTDNSMDPDLEKKVQGFLVQASEGKPIITVSQKPMGFGQNICVGDIGRSHHSLFAQALAGAKAATTKYIALAEHDCLYTPEHFNWVPPRDDVFYYNTNHWIVQWNKGPLEGQYCHFSRKTLSMLICNRELFVEAIHEKILMLEAGATLRKGQPGACEPGVCDNRTAFVYEKAELYKNPPKDLGKHSKKYTAARFRTEMPNIDIRHGNNFSGGRGRGVRRKSYSIPYWGSFHAVMGEPPPGRWYQAATIRGVEMPTRRGRDTNAKRWEVYLKPHIRSIGGGVFIELGCNSGYYCRKAVDLGYTTAIGVEKDPDALRQAHYLETCDPKGVKIIESAIQEYDIPDADIVLLSCIHYWLTPHEVKALERTLRGRARRVVVMARRQSAETHKSPSGHEDILGRFSEWVLGSFVKRKKHYSQTFINPYIGNVVSMSVDEIFPKQKLARSRFYSAFGKLVATGDGTDYEAYLKWRKFPAERLNKKKSLISSVKENGILRPLIMEGDRVVDGDHRLIIAKTLGMPNVNVMTKT